MRVSALLLSSALLAAAGAASGTAAHAAPARPPAVSGAAVPASAAAPVYVWNLYGAESGRAARRPARLVLSEHTTLHDLTWRRWGPAKAVGKGRVLGTWCLPHCLEKPYPATVRLSKPVHRKGKRYFTRYVVEAPTVSRSERAAADLKGALPTP